MLSTLLANAVHETGLWNSKVVPVVLTMSLLSMFTLRRLTATALISFSFIHDLNSLTAKAAETPVQSEQFYYWWNSKHREPEGLSTGHLVCQIVLRAAAVLPSKPSTVCSTSPCPRTLQPPAHWTFPTTQYNKVSPVQNSTLLAAI